MHVYVYSNGLSPCFLYVKKMSNMLQQKNITTNLFLRSTCARMRTRKRSGSHCGAGGL